MAKYYVVWSGVKPGVYNNWEECKKNVYRQPGARYKSFNTKKEAVLAFESESLSLGKVLYPSICVDGAYSSSKLKSEYRIVNTESRELLSQGCYDGGTNNLAEYLGLLEAINYLHENNLMYPIYTDSVTALAWFRECKMSSGYDLNNSPIMKSRLEELESKIYGGNNFPKYQIFKWDTIKLGEIPADFGRK